MEWSGKGPNLQNILPRHGHMIHFSSEYYCKSHYICMIFISQKFSLIYFPDLRIFVEGFLYMSVYYIKLLKPSEVMNSQ